MKKNQSKRGVGQKNLSLCFLPVDEYITTGRSFLQSKIDDLYLDLFVILYWKACLFKVRQIEKIDRLEV